MLVQRLSSSCRGMPFALLALVLVAQQVLVGNDVGPMVAARVVHAEQDLAEARQAGQCLQGLGGNEEIPNTITRGWQPWGPAPGC